MDYSKSKVYRIVVGDYYYIGSTTMALDARLRSHKYMAKKHPTMKVYKAAIDLGWENVKIELVEDVSCNNKQELLIAENKHIRLSDPYCLNCRPSHLTDDEKKERERQQNIKYRKMHLDRLKQYQKEYRASLPALTEEEQEKRRTYHREYMRKRRAAVKSD